MKNFKHFITLCYKEVINICITVFCLSTYHRSDRCL